MLVFPLLGCAKAPLGSILGKRRRKVGYSIFFALDAFVLSFKLVFLKLILLENTTFSHPYSSLFDGTMKKGDAR